MPPDEQYAQQEQNSLNDIAFGTSTAQTTFQSKMQELFTSIFSSLNN
jgi:hypothetical protein